MSAANVEMIKSVQIFCEIMADNIQLKAAVLSVSDTRHEKNDLSGVTLVGLLIGIGAEIIEKKIVSDDYENVRRSLADLSARDDVNLIFTTGGTGFSERDNTPEATLAVIEKNAPGLAEAMRLETAKKRRPRFSHAACAESPSKL